MFGFDPNGNLTSDGSVTFIYDVENRLVKATGAKNAELTYDPLGRLWEMNPNASAATSLPRQRFLYDGDALVAEYTDGGSMTGRYVHGFGADTPYVWYTGNTVTSASRRHLFANWQGSISLITNATGFTVLGINAYDAYGIPNAANIGRFQYTGQIWLPELGLYHYKARIYSPTLGRFLQTDPIGYEDQVNLYAYVGNDPVNLRDPSGMQTTGTRIKKDTEEEDEFDATLGNPRHTTFGNSVGGRQSNHVNHASINLASDDDDDQWTTNDFVSHYFNGNGRAVDLGEIGLGERFENTKSVQRAIAFIKADLIKQSDRGTKIGYFRANAAIDLTNNGPLYSVGDSLLVGSIRCETVCGFKFSIRDFFRDPLDIGYEVPGGTPYQINYDFYTGP